MPSLFSVFGVEPRRIGGTEMFARELSVQLGAQGWQSVLCFLSEPTEEVRHFLDLPNVTFEILSNSTDGDAPARHNLSLLLKKHRPEVLHLHFVSFLTFYPWVAKFKSVRQVFFTDHHSRPAGHVPQRAPFWKRVAARIIGQPLSKVICVSNYGYRCMTAVDLLPRSRYEMIYNGVDLSRVDPGAGTGPAFRKRFGIPENHRVVTQVCWMIPEKGVLDFLAMARLVAAQKEDVQFVLVGEGKEREQYMKEAASMGLADRITWTGMMDDPFGEGVFDAADVVCQFSRWEEVFGWMIAEAMAHAKPVVATRVGGIPELIDDGVSGYLVDRSDSTAMSSRVLELLNNDDGRARMGKAAREIVKAKFDLRTNVSQLVESYGIEVSEARASARARFGKDALPDGRASDTPGNQPRLSIY
ncbi:MAG: glycosyltransferase family 4 protein [Pyrinomonadaceae bacterium]